MGGDLRVHNARIWTGRPDRPWARTLSIARGRIVAVDHEGSGGEERGPVIDARGRTVAPGLIDAIRL